MEEKFILTVLVVIAAFIIVVAFLGISERNKRIAKTKSIIRKRYGKRPEDLSDGQLKAAEGYYKRHEKDHQIDQITFNDFSLNTLFSMVNNTYSSAGEEYLYYMLRTPRFDEEYLNKLEDDIKYYMEHADEREQTVFEIANIGKLKGYSLYDYLESQEMLGKRKQLKHIAAILFLIISILLIFISTGLGIICLIATFFFNIMSYYSEKSKVLMYMKSLSYVVNLTNAAGKLVKKCKYDDMPELLTESFSVLEKDLGALKKLSSGSKYVFSSAVNGSVFSMLFDYINMILHIDIILFNSMINQLYERRDNIDSMVGAIGYIESTIAIGSFRNMLPAYCLPTFTEADGGTKAQDIYHPYLDKPVKNSYELRRGMLVTGSNASGKSTFLRTIGINTLMAQTIHTVCADSFTSRFYRIYSSMSLADNLLGGDSYFMAEIKSMKRIVDSIDADKVCLMCFVDEVLRGTNTVERIAASTQILKYLSTGNVLCLAATHDIELTSLLEDCYDNYHFKENFDNGDITFDYKLIEGKATSRNAIKLLNAMGYDRSIIKAAEDLAENFVKTGIWN